MSELISRKNEHINLAVMGQENNKVDLRNTTYEPMMTAHNHSQSLEVRVAGKKLSAPLWISSMTGGTSDGMNLNAILAKAAAKAQIGFSLGSCRVLLEDKAKLNDFDFRELMGDDACLWGNLGIAQLSELVKNNNLNQLADLVSKLRWDGLFIHVNPIQEYVQLSGDRWEESPIKILETFLTKMEIPLIVKEVGSGMGPSSLKALCELPLVGIEFGSHGGTNFPKIEKLRRDELASPYNELTQLGHNMEEMCAWWNALAGEYTKEKVLILSGGLRSLLKAYDLAFPLKGTKIFGQAMPYLRMAQSGVSDLDNYIHSQKEVLAFYKNYLVGKEI